MAMIDTANTSQRDKNNSAEDKDSPSREVDDAKFLSTFSKSNSLEVSAVSAKSGSQIHELAS